jgi:hypothetical protein
MQIGPDDQQWKLHLRDSNPVPIYYYDCQVDASCLWGITTHDLVDGEKQSDQHTEEHDKASEHLLNIAEQELWT